MTLDVHERACRLVIADRVESLASSDRKWLEQHLMACQECRVYAAGLQDALRGVRLAPFAAGAALVQQTQARVAARAAEMHRQQQQMRPLWLAVTMVCAMTALSLPLFVQALEWAASRFHVSLLLCEAGFLLLWIAPTVVASVALLGRGLYQGRWQRLQSHYSQELQ